MSSTAGTWSCLVFLCQSAANSSVVWGPGFELSPFFLLGRVFSGIVYMNVIWCTLPWHACYYQTYKMTNHCKTTMLGVCCSDFSIVLDELMQAYKGSRMVGRRLKEDSWRQGCAWWRNMDGVHQGWQARIPDQCAWARCHARRTN